MKAHGFEVLETFLHVPHVGSAGMADFMSDITVPIKY